MAAAKSTETAATLNVSGKLPSVHFDKLDSQRMNAQVAAACSLMQGSVVQMISRERCVSLSIPPEAPPYDGQLRVVIVIRYKSSGSDRKTNET